MKTIRVVLTYAIALICIISAWIVPKPLQVNHPLSHREFEDEGIIFVMDSDHMIVPITVAYQKSENDEENIHTLIQLMKQNVEVSGFETLIPQSIQLLKVAINGKKVTLFVNQAIYMMNSMIELRVIEALVGVVIQFDNTYTVQFNVLGEIATQMPLSHLPLTELDETLGFNNFKNSANDLHQTRSLLEVKRKENQESVYYVIQSQRISRKLNQDAVIDLLMQPYRNFVERCEVDDKKVVLHLTQQALIDETSIQLEEIKPLLFSLHFMQHIQQFQFLVDDEIVSVIGNNHSILEIEKLSLNRFVV